MAAPRAARVLLILLSAAIIFSCAPLHKRARAEGQSRPPAPLSLSAPLSSVWRFQTAETTDLSVTSHDGTLYLPLWGGIAALQLSDGSLKWRTEVGGELSAAPCSDERGVYVASSNSPTAPSQKRNVGGVVRLLGAQSGVALWARTLPGAVIGSLLVSDGHVYAATDQWQVYALSKLTGEVVWVLRHDAPFGAPPALLDGRLAYGDVKGRLFLADPAKGTPLRSYRTRGPVSSQPLIRGERIYVGSADRHIYCFNIADGKLLWRSGTGAAVQALANTEGGVIATSLDNFVYSISPVTGRRLWKRRLSGRAPSGPLVADGAVLLAPLSSDECVVLSADTGRKINSVRVGADDDIAAAPRVSGGFLLLTTRRGLYAYSSAASQLPRV